MAKSNSVATKKIDLEGRKVEITFADGTAQSLSLNDLNDEIITRLALHGLSQKLGDSYAGAGTEDDPVAVATAAVGGVIENLMEGNWTQRATGTSGPRVTMLAEALSRATGKPVEECAELVNELKDAADTEDASDEDKARFDAVKNHPAVKAEMSKIRAERAAAKAEKDAAKGADAPDLGSLLG